MVAHVVEHTGTVLRDRVGARLDPWPVAADDPAGAFLAARTAVERVLADPATPAEVVEHIDDALSFDLPQHGWDLAKATGQDPTIDPHEVAALWAALAPASPGFWAWQRAHGYYGPPVAVPDDAPLQDRVLGLTGRDPAWTPPG